MQITFKIPDYWPKLKIGDNVNLISPSFALKLGQLPKIKDFLTDWGLKPQIFSYSSLNKEAFLAHADDQRLAELENAFNASDCDFILSTRGGYGSARILDQFLANKTKPKFKLLTGFSDITSLHLAFNNCLGFSSLHSPVLTDIATNRINKKSIEFFRQIIFGEVSELSYDINQLNPELKIEKLPKLLGGNLTLIQTSIGTKWQINNSSQYCMLIEEIDEEAYKIDRSLNHLKNAGIFNNCRAIFFGDMIEKADSNNQYHLKRIITEFISDINIPTFEIKNIGHDQNNLAIPLGLEPELKDLS